MADSYKLKRGGAGRFSDNRILGMDMVPPDSLLANTRNWRIHPKYQQDALAGVLKEIGWIAPVTVNLRRGEEWPENDRGVATVVDGHLRIALALRAELEEVPVQFVDLSPEEEALALATLDPLSELAAADAEILDELLADVTVDDAAVRALLEEQQARVKAMTTDFTFGYDDEVSGFSGGDQFNERVAVVITMDHERLNDVREELFAWCDERDLPYRVKPA